MPQLSLFGAEAADPSVYDLDGLVLAGGHWVRSGARSGVRPDETARLSIVVDRPWRATALAMALAERGVATEHPDDAVVPAANGHAVRTSFAHELNQHAARWTRGANRGVPPDFALTAAQLRLWAIATGRRDEVGFLLRTPPDERLHQLAGAELSRLGVPAVSIGRRGGPGWRVTSERRLRRLAELVGPAPSGSEADWLEVADHRGR